MPSMDYIRVFRERWLVVPALLLIGVIVGTSIWLIKPAEYTAGITFYVSSPSVDASTSSAFQGAQLSEQRVASYEDLVRSPRILSEVIAQLGLQTSIDQLGEQISTNTLVDSVLIDVRATDESPQRAAAIVNAIGTQFPGLVNELETPLAPNTAPSVAVRVVQPASPPTVPTSTSVTTSIALGALIGLASGVVAAFLLDYIDNTVKSPRDLQQITKSTNIGVTIAEQGAGEDLSLFDPKGSANAEAIRKIRTNLQFIDIDKPHKALIVSSAIAGEGKSTTITNLAASLSAAGQSVLLVDCDLRRPSIARIFGIDGEVGLTSILTGRVAAAKAIQHARPGIDVIASGPIPPNPSELLSSQHMLRTIRDLKARYDIVLLDTPPILPVTDATALAPHADGIVLVSKFGVVTRREIEATVDALETVSIRLLGTIMTMVPPFGPHAHGLYYDTYRSIASGSRASQLSEATERIRLDRVESQK